MERMEHFREATLKQDDNVVLEHLEGYLGFHEKSHGRKQYHGYFELTSGQHINANVHYTLVLADGRAAEINAADVPASDVPGRDVHVAEFYVVGEMHGPRRGLRDEGRHRLA